MLRLFCTALRRCSIILYAHFFFYNISTVWLCIGRLLLAWQGECNSLRLWYELSKSGVFSRLVFIGLFLAILMISFTERDLVYSELVHSFSLEFVGTTIRLLRLKLLLLGPGDIISAWLTVFSPSLIFYTASPLSSLGDPMACTRLHDGDIQHFNHTYELVSFDVNS